MEVLIAICAVWAVLAVAALIGLARGPHRTPPLPIRRRDDDDPSETARRSP